MKVCPNYVHFDGLNLSGALHIKFLIQNAKKYFLKKLSVLFVVFIALKFRLLQTSLADLINPKLLIVCL